MQLLHIDLSGWYGPKNQKTVFKAVAVSTTTSLISILQVEEMKNDNFYGYTTSLLCVSDIFTDSNVT